MFWRVLWALSILAPSVASGTELRGFMGFNFGMTKQEALAARPGSQLRACEYVRTAFCLELPVSIGGYAGKLQALFDARYALIHQINLRFNFRDNLSNANCEQLTHALSDFLVERYGARWKQGVPLTHSFEDGARIEFLSLCVQDAPREAASGVHTVAFKHPSFRQFATQ